MKKVLLLAVVALSFLNLSAQDKLSFSKVIQVDSIQKQYIYNGIKEWFGMNFVSAKKVIEVDDKDAGLIIANAITDYSIGKFSYLAFNGYLKYTVKVQIKDGRFKIEVTNFTHESRSDNFRDYWSIGLISNSDESNLGKGFDKSKFNKVWIDLKFKSESLSNEMIGKFEKIKFYSNSTVGKGDNW